MKLSPSRAFVASLLFTLSVSCATTGPKGVVVEPLFKAPIAPPESTHAPSVSKPEHEAPIASQTKFYRLMIKNDPATSIVIGYSLPSGSTLRTKLFYDVKDYGADVIKYSKVAEPTATNEFKSLNNIFVELSGLRADTVYYFVVSDGKGLSPRFSFRTTPAVSTAKLSVIAGGDSRSNQIPRQLANLLVPKLRPHFVMFAGDMTTLGSDEQWAQWFEDWQLTIARDGRMTGVLFTRGNHESSNEILEKLFYTSSGVYYAVSFANDLLRVYTLNSEMPAAGAQTEWLKGDLAKHESIKYKFAQYHRPIRPHTSGKSDNSGGYTYWAPLFHKFKVDLVSEADAHTVKYTWPIRPSTSAGSQEGFVRDDAAGTVYIGEGCWGAPLRANNDIRAWTRDTARFNSFHWIFVDSKQTEVRTVKVDNAQKVGELTDKNRFTKPANLDVWVPSNGEVITIKP